ncbi:MAG: prepilin-type N-terminal cleavage/methylation domain-containing protein [Gemmataceae bacterium]
MRRHIHSRRRGATLVEVLVAIFLMGIGMLALLTLFPIGVLRMEQALRDDRHTLASINATATATIQSVRTDAKLRDTTDPTKWLFEIGPNGWANPSPHGPSFPVFMDPLGFQNAVAASPNQKFLAYDSTLKSSVYRVPTSFTLSNRSILQWFAINDEIIFETDDPPSAGAPTAALPKLNSGSQFDRNTRVSWAYMLQRPMTSDASLVNMSVVVYADRPTGFSRQFTPAENLYQASFDTNTNKVTLTYAAPTAVPPGVVPNLRSGDWILDCSVEQAIDPANGAAYSIPHANFYRVVSSTELSSTQTIVEIQTPIRGFNRNVAGPYSGQIAVMEGVAEVFGKAWDDCHDANHSSENLGSRRVHPY